MRAVVTRVNSASVVIDGKVNGQIGRGFLILLGVAPDDTPACCKKLAEKILGLRIFTDPEGKMNLSLEDVGGQVLVVSQFTLYADCSRGNRPGYTDAAAPDEATQLYQDFARELSVLGHDVKTGVFGANMQVELVNDGPVTILLESAPA